MSINQSNFMYHQSRCKSKRWVTFGFLVLFWSLLMIGSGFVYVNICRPDYTKARIFHDATLELAENIDEEFAELSQSLTNFFAPRIDEELGCKDKVVLPTVGFKGLSLFCKQDWFQVFLIEEGVPVETRQTLSSPLLRDLMWLTSARCTELRLEEECGEAEMESLPAYQLLREIWEVALAEGSASTPEEILEQLEDSREGRLLRAKITTLA